MVDDQCSHFNSIELLKSRPTHLLVFIHHVMLQFDCAPVVRNYRMCAILVSRMHALALVQYVRFCVFLTLSLVQLWMMCVFRGWGCHVCISIQKPFSCDLKHEYFFLCLACSQCDLPEVPSPKTKSFIFSFNLKTLQIGYISQMLMFRWII